MLRRDLLPVLALCTLITACDDGAGGPTDDTDPTNDTDADPSTVEGVSCDDDGVCTLSGTITEPLTLTADTVWLLKGGVFIGNDNADATTLTIEPGTTVYGESASDGFLTIRRGSRIEAVGRPDAPIVFTSDQPEGSRARGQWGGLVLLGNAPINGCDTAPCEAEIEGGAGPYGGDDPDDDSGTLRYVRVEYAGTEVSPDNELNGISMGGIGSGTELDFIQVHANLDDGVEFFGGTVSAKHVVISCVGDDGIDWDLGWQGRIQHGLVVQCDDAGGYGIEADSNEGNHAAAPFANPTLSNITFVGSPAIAEDNFGIVLRRGTSARLANLAVTGFPAACFALRDDATIGHFEDDEGSIDTTVLGCDTAFEVEDGGDTPEEDDAFAAGTGNAVDVDLGLPGYVEVDPDFRPDAASPLATGGAAPADDWFDDAAYIGGFDPDGDDWTDGWTSFLKK